MRRAYGRTLIALLPLVALYWAIPSDRSVQNLQAAINLTAPFYFIAVLFRLAHRVLRISSDAIWTGALWFPVQSGVFFGFGPLVELFGTDATRRYLSAAPLSLDTTELFRANMLSVTGIALALLGFWLHMRLRRGAWRETVGARSARIPDFQLALVMILTGGGLKYLVINPALWSAHPPIIAGSLGAIASLTDIGFSILAYLAGKGNRRAAGLFWAVWPIHLLLCALSFSKTQIVWAMIFPLIGDFVARRKRLRLVVGLVAIATTYALAQPYVHYGRGIVYQRTGSIERAGYGERLEILGRYLLVGDPSGGGQSDVAGSAPRDGLQGWWIRLDYAGVQAYAMRLYDAGRANPSLDTVWMFFVPRAIWPEKPNLSLVAVRFHRLVTGNEEGTSFLGVSYYGDLYWQYGWWGIFIGTPLIGLLFASMAARSLRAVKRRDFLMMPAILMALNLSLLGPTEFVLDSAVGGSVIYFAYVLLLLVLRRGLAALARG